MKVCLDQAYPHNLGNLKKSKLESDRVFNSCNNQITQFNQKIEGFSNNKATNITNVMDLIDLSEKSTKTIRSATGGFNVEFSFSHKEQKISVDVIKDGSSEKIRIKPENLTKDLLKIDNPKVFNAFLDSVHVKVVSLSDGEFKVYSDVSGVGGMRSDREERARAIAEIILRAEDSGEISISSSETKESLWSKIKKSSVYKFVMESIEIAGRLHTAAQVYAEWGKIVTFVTAISKCNIF